MKRFLLAITLACALCGTALAGNIPTGGAPSPENTQTPPSVVDTIILTIISLVS